MITLGIDPSLTGTGVVVLEGDEIKEKLLLSTSPRAPMLERMGSIASDIVACCKRWHPDKVAIEGLAIYGSNNGAGELAGLHWHIRMELGAEEKLDVVPPSVLKKFVCGKGNANKNVMLMKILKRWDEEFIDDNLADAYALARYAQQ